MQQPTTRATSSPSETFDRGRIRVSAYDAGELYQALALRREALLDARLELADAGFETNEFFNRKIAALRRAMGEIERTAREKGWPTVLAVITQYAEDAD